MNMTARYTRYGLTCAFVLSVRTLSAAALANGLPACCFFQTPTKPIRKAATPTAQQGLVLKTITVPVWYAPNSKGIAPISLSLQITNRGDKPIPILAGALRVLLTPAPRRRPAGSVQTSEPLPVKTGRDTRFVAPKTIILAPGKKLKLGSWAAMNEDYAQITKPSGHTDWVHAGELTGDDGNGTVWTIGKIVPGRYTLRLQLKLADARLVTSPPVSVEMR